MALFKFRKGGADTQVAPAQPESVEAMRRRARHRLIGAAVLVLLGVIGFPLLFDTQPRPVAVDIPIEIPDRNQVKPLPQPAAQAQPAAPARPVASGSVAMAPGAAAPAASKATPASGTQAKPDPRAGTTEPARAEAPAAKPVPPVAARVESASRPVVPADNSRAQALLDGKAAQAAAQDETTGRFVVQVGAFADDAKAREARAKLEKAGLKTYTHVAETKDGKRTRVRVGPFGTRVEADKAAGRIKELEMPAAVLTL